MSAVAARYDRLARRYDSGYVSPRDAVEDRHVARLLYRLVNRQDGPASVLDLGCGTGQGLRLLPYDRIHRYVGVDISDGMLRQARERFGEHHRVRWVRAPMERLPRSLRDRFDLAISIFGSFNYVDPDITLRALKDHLAPHARVALVVYARRRASRERTYITRLPSRLYSADELHQTLERCGYTVEHLSGMSLAHRRFDEWMYLTSPRAARAAFAACAPLRALAPDLHHYLVAVCRAGP